MYSPNSVPHEPRKEKSTPTHTKPLSLSHTPHLPNIPRITILPELNYTTRKTRSSPHVFFSFSDRLFKSPLSSTSRRQISFTNVLYVTLAAAHMGFEP